MQIKANIAKLILAGGAAFAALAPQAASAGIIYDDSIRITGTGFGAEPRLITLQETGPRRDGVQSACVSVGAGGSFAAGAGSCISDAQVFQGNGFTNFGGDEVNPLRDQHKYGIPTVGETGWKDASDIALIFNATQPAGGPIEINDITLKFYDNNGTLVAAIDGGHYLESTFAGNGVAGFTFVVDEEQQAWLNSTVFGLPGFGDLRIALETTNTGAAGGPESWWAYNLDRSGGSTSTGGTPIPAPAGLWLFAIGLAGLGWRFGRKS